MTSIMDDVRTSADISSGIWNWFEVSDGVRERGGQPTTGRAVIGHLLCMKQCNPFVKKNRK